MVTNQTPCVIMKVITDYDYIYNVIDYYYPNMTSLVSIRCLDSEQWNDTNLEPCWRKLSSCPNNDCK